jgi:hypothetical protein
VLLKSQYFSHASMLQRCGTARDPAAESNLVYAIYRLYAGVLRALPGRFRRAAPPLRLGWALGGDAAPERFHEIDNILMRRLDLRRMRGTA